MFYLSHQVISEPNAIQSVGPLIYFSFFGYTWILLLFFCFLQMVFMCL